MILLEQRYDLHPAAPDTVDRFIDLATSQLVPAQEKAGARLVGAFQSHDRWFSQVVQLLHFPDLAAHGAFHEAMKEHGAIAKHAFELAPRRHAQLFESLGPVPDETLDAAIEASAAKPENGYSFAILEVAAGRMADFENLLGAAAGRLPIVAALTPVAGNPDLVVDLWKGTLGATPYAPADANMHQAFFEPLRQVAPSERLEHLYALPYSPLR